VRDIEDHYPPEGILDAVNHPVIADAESQVTAETTMKRFDVVVMPRVSGKLFETPIQFLLQRRIGTLKKCACGLGKKHIMHQYFRLSFDTLVTFPRRTCSSAACNRPAMTSAVGLDVSWRKARKSAADRRLCSSSWSTRFLTSRRSC
jgi:hypothetical protein